MPWGVTLAQPNAAPGALDNAFRGSDLHPEKPLLAVVHEVNDQSVLIEDKEGMFLGLAYDARKAFERQRTVIKPEKHFPEMGVRYGVEILWPVLLLQCRLLRCSLAYFDSSKRQQAITYALEDVIETAIDEAYGAEAASIALEWRRMDASQPVVVANWDSRGAQFCLWSGTECKTKLAGLLTSFDPMYDWSYSQSLKDGDTGLVSPAGLDALESTEWADPQG
jgi:hypothetical protein